MGSPVRKLAIVPWGIFVGALWALSLTRMAPPDGVDAAVLVAVYYLAVYSTLWCMVGLGWAWAWGLNWPGRQHGIPLVVIAASLAATLVIDNPFVVGLGVVVATALVAVDYRPAWAVGRVMWLFTGLAVFSAVAIPVFDEWAQWIDPVDLGPRTRMAGRVHVIGVDGLDSAVLEQLLDEHELPGFSALLDRAAATRVTPLSGNSPELWTSYVTGRRPEVHGIVGFTNRYLTSSSVRLPVTDLDFVSPRLGLTEQRGLSSAHRRSPALWELLGQVGGTVSVHNWWATWPAEPVPGTMISRRAFLVWAEGDVSADSTYPASLNAGVGARMRALLPEPASATRVERFAATDSAAWSTYRDACFDSEVDLCLVYQRLIDVASHAYSRTVFPDGAGTPDDGLFEELVVAAYATFDGRLLEVLDALGPDDSLVVVSDHGWRYDGTEHDYHPADGWPAGAMFLIAPGLEPSSPVETIRTVDVFPSLAALVGVPLANDLPGHASALTARFASPGTVSTYGRRHSSPAPAAATTGIEAGDLRALGYIQ